MARRTAQYEPLTIPSAIAGEPGDTPDDLGGDPVAIDDDGRVTPISANGDIPIVDPGSGDVTGASFGAGDGDSDRSGNNNGDSLGEFDPGGEPVRKRRGRQPGTKNKPKEASFSGSLKGVEQLLITVHMMGAALLKVPEFQISPEEAHGLTEAINGVTKHYSVAISEKTLAWANLISMGVGIYGSRLIALKLKKDREKVKKLETVGPRPMPPAPAQKPLYEAPKEQVNGAPKPQSTVLMMEPNSEHYMKPPVDILSN